MNWNHNQQHQKQPKISFQLRIRHENHDKTYQNMAKHTILHRIFHYPHLSHQINLIL